MSTTTEDFGGATVYGFEPHEWQREFIHSTAREVLGSGAFGSGKTRALTERCGTLLIAYPGNRGLLARNTFAALQNTTLETLTEEVIPDSWVVDDLSNKQKHVIAVQSPLYPAAYCTECGFETDYTIHGESVWCPKCETTLLTAVPASRLYYEGLQTTDVADIPEKILSLELGFVAVDEVKDITESAWKALSGRLRLNDLNNPYVPELPYHSIFGTTNPADPNHWLHRRFYEQGKGEYYESETADNIANLPDGYLENLRDQYGEGTAEAERYIEGQWRGYTGNVYDEWRDAIHLIEPLDVEETLGEGWRVANREALADNEAERSTQVGNPKRRGDYTPARVYPPEETPLILSVDWGYRPDPTVVQWWALTERHGYVLYRELFQTRQLPDDMARLAMDHMAAHEYDNIRRVYADHDSGDREAWLDGAREYVEDLVESGEVSGSEAPEWRRLQTTAASKNREQGVYEVKRLIRPDENNRAGLHIIRGTRAHQKDQLLASNDKPGSTLQELRGYGYESEDSDDPQDYNDHGMDAMRYMAFSEKKKGRDGWGTAVIKS